ncbi:helix-turn-helix domain-containing protein [Agreia sp. PsM10]|uniref:helix-turn-helix domain-containing protein n=1 Tax=Agreia sp. PsM10 TaxID=3030533 RepID=UPI00263AABF7|nr:helix-turn-helix domain-containing protein [Agreia sp. PsM10]MDN4641852.1 helix-turn-helix domain-containing protein [Agreia sp. PsM10]
MSTVAESQRRSKLLFNNAHVLSIAAMIEEGQSTIDSKTLQANLALSQSTVQRVLRTLEGIGLLERQERTARTESLRYRRIPHGFWSSARALHDADELEERS